jgi:hypothetical protein
MTANVSSQNVIRFYAKNATILGFVFILLMAGLAWFTNFNGFGIWMMFIVFGAIAFGLVRELCREISNLHKRVEDLEKKINS